MNSNRKTCVLYATATCNLKCKYCYIDKSPILKKIDEKLEESFKGDYYFNFMKKMFNDKNSLEKIEIWGGEPSYGLDRTIHTINKAIEYFPNLNNFMFSTNFVAKDCLLNIYNFCLNLKKYPNRDFILFIQLSLDGPENINDFNRGKGTSNKFKENFINFAKTIDYLLEDVPNLTIQTHFKPTLDSESIKLLQTKQSIYDYYKYFEEYLDLKIKYSNTDRWNHLLPVPNMATPASYTQEDGKNFANLCKISYELTKETKEKDIFKYFQSIVPYALEAQYCPNSVLGSAVTACGSGNNILGLLPEEQISVCHNGFVEVLEEYSKNSTKYAQDNLDRTIDFHMFTKNSNMKNDLIFSYDEYKIYENKMKCYYCNNTKFFTTELSSLIHTYAINNQIDEKYKDLEECVKAAYFIIGSTPSCIRDNIGITGSLYLYQTGFIKLLLNGAKEYIEKTNELFRE